MDAVVRRLINHERQREISMLEKQRSVAVLLNSAFRADLEQLIQVPLDADADADADVEYTVPAPCLTLSPKPRAQTRSPMPDARAQAQTLPGAL